MIHKYSGNPKEGSKFNYQITVSKNMFGPTFDLIKNKKMYEEMTFLDNFFNRPEEVILYLIGAYNYYTNTHNEEVRCKSICFDNINLHYNITDGGMDLFIFTDKDINLVSADVKSKLNQFEQTLKKEKSKVEMDKRKFKSVIEELYPVFEEYVKTSLKYNHTLVRGNIEEFWKIVIPEKEYSVLANSYKGFRKYKIIDELIDKFQKKYCRTMYH